MLKINKENAECLYLMSKYIIKGFNLIRQLTYALIILLLCTTIVVAINSSKRDVAIHNYGFIQNLSKAYYIYENTSIYYLIDLSDYSIVDQGNDFATLTNKAITLAKNSGGGTVYICPGEHLASQPIMLASNVKLMGAIDNPLYTVIKQQPSEIWYPGVIGIVDASNVEIAYLTIDMKNSPLVNGSSWPPKGNGITFRDDDYDDNNIYIHHVRILHAACYGIKTHFGSNIRISDVYVEGAWWDCLNISSNYTIIENVIGTHWGDVGIAVYNAKHVTISKCLLYDPMSPPGGGSSGVFGITFEGARYSIVSDVIIRNSPYGIAAYTQSNNIVTDSVFINTFNVIGMTNSYQNIITDCQFINSTLQIRGKENHVINCLFYGGGIQLQDNPDYFKIIGNDIINARRGIEFVSGGTNGIIKGNHIYSDTIPSSTHYAIDFGYRVHIENITVAENDFTYDGVPNFRYSVLNLAECTFVNLNIKNNLGYLTENSGIAINVADGSQILHGLAGIPDRIILTCLNATYDDIPVLVYWDKQNTNNSYFTIRVYWVNGTAITDNVIAISWTAEYSPP